jgi:hypothetical protein
LVDIAHAYEMGESITWRAKEMMIELHSMWRVLCHCSPQLLQRKETD